ECGQQNIQRNLIRRFLTLCTFNQMNHPVEEAGSRFGSRSNNQPVRENARTAGNGASVASRFADNRGTFACDRTFVDGRNFFDYLSIDSNYLPHLNKKSVSFSQFG